MPPTRPEQGLPLGQHHFGVVSTCLAHGPVRRVASTSHRLYPPLGRLQHRPPSASDTNGGISVFCSDERLSQMDLVLEEAIKTLCGEVEDGCDYGRV